MYEKSYFMTDAKVKVKGKDKNCTDSVSKNETEVDNIQNT